jgi:hypothetical protein
VTLSPPLPSRAALLTALATLLAGCPIPQSLPEYPLTGKIAPPRIVADDALPSETIIVVAPDCPGADADHLFVLSTSLIDENTKELVEARWFVDYEVGRSTERPYESPPPIQGPTDGITVQRPLAPFQFRPYTFDDPAFRLAGGLHVVELVVSNGFAPEPAVPPNARPYRTPLAQFETQVFRWVFHYTPGGACGYPPP